MDGIYGNRQTNIQKIRIKKQTPIRTNVFVDVPSCMESVEIVKQIYRTIRLKKQTPMRTNVFVDVPNKRLKQ